MTKNLMTNPGALLLRTRTALWVPMSSNDSVPILMGKCLVPLQLVTYCVQHGLVVYDKLSNQHCVELGQAYWKTKRANMKSPHYKGWTTYYAANHFRKTEGFQRLLLKNFTQ